MHRKNFIKQALGGMAGLTLIPKTAFTATINEPEPIKTELVKEFVIAGHGKFDRVKEMLIDYPSLLYCKYDWGKGDYEEAIEGAGHVGNKEIANYLIEQGARVNLFVLTMLGKMALVKPVLEQYPALIFSRGAHGFTLLHHAKVGEARVLYDYLQEKGLNETQIKI